MALPLFIPVSSPISGITPMYVSLYLGGSCHATISLSSAISFLLLYSGDCPTAGRYMSKFEFHSDCEIAAHDSFLSFFSMILWNLSSAYAMSSSFNLLIA